MRNFLHPTKTKVLITIFLGLYICVSVFLLASLNCARCNQAPPQWQQFTAMLGLPGLFLGAPFFYISQSFFESERDYTVRELMIEDGMQKGPAYPDPILDEAQIAKNPSGIGLCAALFGELTVLYVLSCVIVWIRDWRRATMSISVS